MASRTDLAFAIYLAAYVVVSASSLLFLRSALADASAATAATRPLLYVGTLGYAFSFAIFLLALRNYEVLFVYPTFVGGAYAAVSIGAAVFLGEAVTPTRLAGIVLVGVALLLLAR